MASFFDTNTSGKQLQLLLLRLEMTVADLAREAKLSQKTIKDALAADGQPSLRTRCAIEAALGQAVWSTPEAFQSRKDARTLLGLNPETASLKTLKQHASRLRIKGYGKTTNKAALARLIVDTSLARIKRALEVQRLAEKQL